MLPADQVKAAAKAINVEDDREGGDVNDEGEPNDWDDERDHSEH